MPSRTWGATPGGDWHKYRSLCLRHITLLWVITNINRIAKLRIVVMLLLFVILDLVMVPFRNFVREFVHSLLTLSINVVSSSRYFPRRTRPSQQFHNLPPFALRLEDLRPGGIGRSCSSSSSGAVTSSPLDQDVYRSLRKIHGIGCDQVREFLLLLTLCECKCLRGTLVR